MCVYAHFVCVHPPMYKGVLMYAFLSSKLKQHAPEALPWGNRNQKLKDKISFTKKK